MRKVECAGAIVLGQLPHHGDDWLVALAEQDQNGTITWGLPKGHIEPGESAEEAALREVEEETGLVVQLVTPLGAIQRISAESDGEVVQKTIHMFLALAQPGDEGFASWVHPCGVSKNLHFQEDRDFAQRHLQLLIGQQPAF